MTSRKHHRLISKIRTHAVNLAVWSVIMVTPALIASPPLHAQAYQVIHQFDLNSPEGAYPNGLTRDAAGNLFGTTEYANNNNGTVFKLDSTHVFTVLHTFAGSPDGAEPLDRVILDSAGNLYGTTISGGVGGFGTVFKIDPTGVETVLHSFTRTDGWEPGRLIRDTAGNLYGSTRDGGMRGGGVVFRINPSGTERTLYKFTGPDGSQPYAGVPMAKGLSSS
jgi:uncharacterized repeat protein (TIGR03803 family)